jgi:hypothetical protein
LPHRRGLILLDIIVILALIAALAAVVVFQNAVLALVIVLIAMIAAFFTRKRGRTAATGRAPTRTAKNAKTSWVVNCPKCDNVIKSREVECGNCGEAEIRVVGGSRPRLKCGHCASPANDPTCPKCQTIIAAKFWR